MFVGNQTVICFILIFFLPKNVQRHRSSHQRCSIKKGVLRNFTNFTGKHLCQSLFFNKVAGLRPATLLKKRLWHRCFPVNFVKFLRTPFLQNTSGRLLLETFTNTCHKCHNSKCHKCIQHGVHMLYVIVVILDFLNAWSQKL